MHSRLCIRLARPPPCEVRRASLRAAAFSSSSAQRANDPATDLMDAVKPQRTRRPEPANPMPSRSSDLPIDGTNPMMQGYPSADKRGTMTTSTATPDTTTPEPGSALQEDAATRSEQYRTIQGTGPPTQAPRSSHESLQDIMRPRTPMGQGPRSAPGKRTLRHHQPIANQPRQSNFRQGIERFDADAGRERRLQFAQEEKARRESRETMWALERQMARSWRAGDVYAPHDLSPAEQMKSRTARQAQSRFRIVSRARSRNSGGADAFDVIGLDPVKEYKNYKMMGEFVSDAGRIRGAKETGLRAVNQRKLAKAVRRSIGMGLIPSVHRHPELFPDRENQRQYVWSRNAIIQQTA